MLPATVVYLIVITILVVVRPEFMYNKKKDQFREFGTTDGKTPFTLPVMAVMTAVIVHVVITIVQRN